MALNDEIDMLAALPLLGQLERDALRRLALSAHTRILRKGETLFQTGDVADGGYIVLSGEIALEGSEEKAQPQIAQRGDLLGEIALLVETPWDATAVAQGPASVIHLPRALMYRTLPDFPRSTAALKDVIEQRLAGLTQGLEGVRQSLLKLEQSEA